MVALRCSARANGRLLDPRRAAAFGDPRSGLPLRAELPVVMGFLLNDGVVGLTPMSSRPDRLLRRVQDLTGDVLHGVDMSEYRRDRNVIRVSRRTCIWGYAS